MPFATSQHGLHSRGDPCSSPNLNRNAGRRLNRRHTCERPSFPTRGRSTHRHFPSSPALPGAQTPLGFLVKPSGTLSQGLAPDIPLSICSLLNPPHRRSKQVRKERSHSQVLTQKALARAYKQRHAISRAFPILKRRNGVLK